MNTNQIVCLLLSLALTFAGVILILIETAGKTSEYLWGVGLTLIVSGVFTMFREEGHRCFESGDAVQARSSIADKVHERLPVSPLMVQGGHVVSHGGL